MNIRWMSAFACKFLMYEKKKEEKKLVRVIIDRKKREKIGIGRWKAKAGRYRRFEMKGKKRIFSLVFFIFYFYFKGKNGMRGDIRSFTLDSLHSRLCFVFYTLHLFVKKKKSFLLFYSRYFYIHPSQSPRVSVHTKSRGGAAYTLCSLIFRG